jgi:tRNA(fMet)-specific endonuclease VapC
MLFGAAIAKGSRKRELIERYLRDVVGPTLPVFPYDAPAAEVHAIERARLSRLGKTPPFADGQIAAIARVNGLVLVTRNVADFRAFEGLEVESWGR